MPNLSLSEKLRLDFGLALPEFDEDPQPESYFDSVWNVIRKNQPRWRIRRWITLGLFDFSKIVIHRDLDPKRWPQSKPIHRLPQISPFLSGESKTPTPGAAPRFGEERDIDDLPNIHVRYPLVEDADSSQHSSVIEALDGSNLVIEGPPGTGKSQTITNLIAGALSRGKRVLFVAEKLAALEVVKRRLDNAGLGEFCLELHSHKTQKRELLDNLAQRLSSHGNHRAPKEIEADIERYEQLKQTLKRHVERINRPWKNTRWSRHDIFMGARRYQETVACTPGSVHPDCVDGGNFDAAAQRRACDQVLAYRDSYRAISAELEGNKTIETHPWYGIGGRDLRSMDLDRVLGVLSQSLSGNISCFFQGYVASR